MITPQDNQSITSGQEATSTRGRLGAAGLRLFAERGFDAVSVGDIEAEVGLVPRRGALYRHFASKADLLAAAAEDHLASVTRAGSEFASAAAAATLDQRDLGRWILGELDRQRLLTHVLERDGERVPELRDRFRSQVSDGSYRALAEILGSWLSARTAVEDVEALAVLLLGGLVNARRSTWTLGAAPLGLDDERLVEAWARQCEAVVSQPATRGRAGRADR